MKVRSDGKSQFLSCFIFQLYTLFSIKGFQTIVFISIVIYTMFQLICPPAFFRSTYWLKRCESNNKDEDDNPKTLNGKIIMLCLKNFVNLYHLCFK